MTKKNQTISVRITSKDYDEFEMRCRENRINISDVLRKSVYEYLSNFELLVNHNTTYNAKGVA
jgi:hypothetical protein